MAKPSRPPRVFVLLTFVILGGLGVAAYLVNFPLALIVIGEAIVMLWLAWRVTRPKRPQQMTRSGPNESAGGQAEAESSPNA